MISVVQLGSVDYATGLRLQQQLVTLRKDEKIGDVLLLLEHKPVITLGRNAKSSNVIASPELLAQRGVEIFECDRGGDVTFHGPGQIVGYPIFDLRGYARDAADVPSALRKTLGAVDFVRRLEDMLIRTCADFAIPAKRIAGLTGVWTALDSTAPPGTATNGHPVKRSSTVAPADSRSLDHERRSRSGSSFSVRDDNKEQRTASSPQAKLAAIGVHISRSVTSHGFALNVNTDLSYFNLIIPCGITSKPVTSIQCELGHEIDLNAVAESISRNFGVVFQSQMLWLDTIDALLGRTVGVPMQVPEELLQLHKRDDLHNA